MKSWPRATQTTAALHLHGKDPGRDGGTHTHTHKAAGLISGLTRNVCACLTDTFAGITESQTRYYELLLPSVLDITHSQKRPTVLCGSPFSNCVVCIYLEAIGLQPIRKEG